MGRTKVVSRLGRHLSRGSITPLALSAMVCIALLLSTCGSSNTTPDPSSEGSTQAPSLAELSEMLTAELSRLGKDVNKTTSAAPSGSDNAVFDLSAEIIGSREASAYDPGSGRTPNRPAYATGNQDGLAQGPAPTQTSSTSAPACADDECASTGAYATLSKQTSAITGITLSWTERVIGDYDQNGEVNLSDLAPLAIKWQEKVAYDDPAMHGGFTAWPIGHPDGAGAQNWRMARVDGDCNSEINLSDITPIAVHFKEVNHGYQIERAINYGTGTLNWEALPIDIGFGIQPSAPRGETATYNNESPVRYAVTVPLASPEFAHYFRVKPYDETSNTSGELSNVVSYIPSTTTDTVPPYWLNTVGIAKLIPSDENMTVEFGSATDDASPPVSYRVFWAEGDEANPDAPFDYGAAQTVDVAVSPYTITGLTNDQYYRVAVRAVDSADVPNMELNTNLKGQFSGIRDYYPPAWNGAVGIQDLLFGYGMAIVTWQAAEDSTTDENGTWESGPVIYRVYYGIGDTPDYQTASYQDFVDIGLEKYAAPLRELDTTQTHWFSIRALDQATPPNEDTNSAFETTPGLSVTRIDIPSPEDTILEEMESVQNHWFTGPGRMNGVLVQTAESPTDEIWLTVHSYIDSSFEHEYDYYLGQGTARVFQGILEDNGDLTITLRRALGLNDNKAIHFSSSSMSTEEYDLWDSDIREMGINPLGELWIATNRVKEFAPPIFIGSQEIGYLPYTNPTEYWEISTVEERDYYVLWPPAQLADGTVIIPMHGVAPSTLANHKLIFNHEGFQLHDAVPSPLPDYTYRKSYGWGVADPIDVHVSDVTGVGIEFVQGEASRHFSMDSLGIFESEYPALNIGSQMNVENIDSMIIPLRLRTDYWYDDPLNSFEFKCVAVVNEGGVLRVPVGLVVDPEGPYVYSPYFFFPDGKFGWLVFSNILGINAIDIFSIK